MPPITCDGDYTRMFQIGPKCQGTKINEKKYIFCCFFLAFQTNFTLLFILWALILANYLESSLETRGSGD